MTIHNVTNNTELSAAISAATAGDEIVLATGVVFGDINIVGKVHTSPVVIRSANPGARTTVGRVKASHGSEGWRLEDLNSFYDGSNGSNLYQFWKMDDCRNIEFLRCHVETNLSSGAGGSNGVRTGIMIGMNRCHDMKVTACVIRNFMMGVYVLDGSNCTIQDNWIYAGRSDRINFGRIDGIHILRNYLGYAFIVLNDHADVIQCVRGGGKCNNVNILDNIIDQGDGGRSQTIHFGMDGAAKSVATRHTNVLVEGNVIYNGHSNALNFDYIEGLIVRKNSVLGAKGAASWHSEPGINILSSSAYVGVVEDNIFCQILGGGLPTTPSWTVGNNQIVPLANYDANFDYLATGQVDGYHDFRIKAGTALHASGAGSRGQLRVGDWSGAEVVLHADYPGGYAVAAPPPSIPLVPASVSFVGTVTG